MTKTVDERHYDAAGQSLVVGDKLLNSLFDLDCQLIRGHGHVRHDGVTNKGAQLDRKSAIQRHNGQPRLLVHPPEQRYAT